MHPATSRSPSPTDSEYPSGPSATSIGTDGWPARDDHDPRRQLDDRPACPGDRRAASGPRRAGRDRRTAEHGRPDPPAAGNWTSSPAAAIGLGGAPFGWRLRTAGGYIPISRSPTGGSRSNSRAIASTEVTGGRADGAGGWAGGGARGERRRGGGNRARSGAAGGSHVDERTMGPSCAWTSVRASQVATSRGCWATSRSCRPDRRSRSSAR